MAAGVRREDLYIDHGVSGARSSRPQFDRALDALVEGDTLVITTLDRLGRSTQNMLAFADALRGDLGDSLEETIDRVVSKAVTALITGLDDERLAFVQFHRGRRRAFVPLSASMGHTASAGAFCVLTAESLKILRAAGVPCSVYMDDFICAGATREECQQHLDTMLAVLRRLGWRVSTDKIVPPSQCAPWLGYILDTAAGTISLSATRRTELRALAAECLRKARACDTRKLETLVGKLTWAARVVPGGKAFVVAIGAMARLKRPRVTLSPAAVADLRWWMAHGCRPDWNGVRAWYQGEHILHAAFMSDASGDIGYGAHTATEHLWGAWTTEQRARSVMWKELWAVTQAVKTWGPRWRGHTVIIGSDSSGNCYRINSGRAGAADSGLIHLLRELNHTAHHLDVQLLAVHVPREFNNTADLLSKCRTRRAAAATFANILRAGPARTRVPAPGDTRPHRPGNSSH